MHVNDTFVKNHLIMHCLYLANNLIFGYTPFNTNYLITLHQDFREYK